MFPPQLKSTVKPVLSSHSIIDKTKVLKTDGSLMQVESIAECFLKAFCNTFDLDNVIIGPENQYLVFFEWPLKTGFNLDEMTILSLILMNQEKKWRQG